MCHVHEIESPLAISSTQLLRLSVRLLNGHMSTLSTLRKGSYVKDSPRSWQAKYPSKGNAVLSQEQTNVIPNSLLVVDVVTRVQRLPSILSTKPFPNALVKV